ncbi:MAG: hypothetical protein LBP21_08900 [Synergistaceae bacterium]|jgi:hypothetical protein|nr:hypothetical protein [Synergistaceae bacterium]
MTDEKAPDKTPEKKKAWCKSDEDLHFKVYKKDDVVKRNNIVYTKAEWAQHQKAVDQKLVDQKIAAGSKKKG